MRFCTLALSFIAVTTSSFDSVYGVGSGASSDGDSVSSGKSVFPVNHLN